MAAPLLQSQLSLSSSSSLHSTRPSYFRRATRALPLRSYPKRTILVVSPTCSRVLKEEIVVVGAGIAGLATALSLHRLGLGSLVLEQAESLRTGGTSLTLFKNGWRALDAMGVGQQLRPQFLEIQGMVIKSMDGRELRSFTFKKEAPGQEVRAVERRLLLEALAAQLPAGSIRFSSRLETIKRTSTGDTQLELEDGTQVVSKIVVGCDGIRSPIAKWMGFREPNYVGQCAYRGLAFYPGGQPFEPKVTYTYGRGMRAGLVPITTEKVYWFICYNSQTPGPKVTDPSLLKKDARALVKDWQSDVLDAIDETPNETVSRTPLEDRWLWPLLSPGVADGGTVLAGDAWHPMTPNLGQGACCALEDAVMLAKKLARAMTDDGSRGANLAMALQEYERERWARVFPLTIRANFVGSLLQWENPLGCAMRDNIVVPKLVQLGPLLQHTNYECEPLTT